MPVFLSHNPLLRKLYRYTKSGMVSFQEQLEIYAKNYDLEWPVVFGGSFISEVETYFRITLNEETSSRVTSLSQLCWWLSYPLPPHPQQTARDRAKGYLHILQAMAQGVIIVQPREQVTDDVLEDNEDDLTYDEWEYELFYEGLLEDDDDDE